MNDKRLLIVDQNNQFIRSYMAVPTISETTGKHIGGIVGTFKILQKICKEVFPDEIIICWDGIEGSQRRRAKYSEYKKNRKPIRLNRNIQNMTEEEEENNKLWQMVRLMEYFNEFPVQQFMVEYVEADDVVAYATNSTHYKDWQKVILSSDKDFVQLLDSKTILYRPVAKEILNRNKAIEKFGIHPNNFAMAKAITGDLSDNIGGVKGLGFKRLSTCLPFLEKENTFLLEDIIEYCSTHINNSKFYRLIIEQKELIENNYSLMQLHNPMISSCNREKIDYSFGNFVPRFNKTKTLLMLSKDGINNSIDLTTLFQTFRRMIYNKTH